MKPSNKFIGWSVLVCLILAVIGGIAGAGDTFFSVVGILLFVFGAVGAFRLISSEA